MSVHRIVAVEPERGATVPATRGGVEVVAATSPAAALHRLLAQLEREQAIGWTGVSRPWPCDQLPISDQNHRRYAA